MDILLIVSSIAGIGYYMNRNISIDQAPTLPKPNILSNYASNSNLYNQNRLPETRAKIQAAANQLFAQSKNPEQTHVIPTLRTPLKKNAVATGDRYQIPDLPDGVYMPMNNLGRLETKQNLTAGSGMIERMMGNLNPFPAHERDPIGSENMSNTFGQGLVPNGIQNNPDMPLDLLTSRASDSVDQGQQSIMLPQQYVTQNTRNLRVLPKHPDEERGQIEPRVDGTLQQSRFANRGSGLTQAGTVRPDNYESKNPDRVYDLGGMTPSGQASRVLGASTITQAQIVQANLQNRVQQEAELRPGYSGKGTMHRDADYTIKMTDRRTIDTSRDPRNGRRLVKASSSRDMIRVREPLPRQRADAYRGNAANLNHAAVSLDRSAGSYADVLAHGGHHSMDMLKYRPSAMGSAVSSLPMLDYSQEIKSLKETNLIHNRNPNVGLREAVGVNESQTGINTIRRSDNTDIGARFVANYGAKAPLVPGGYTLPGSVSERKHIQVSTSMDSLRQRGNEIQYQHDNQSYAR